MSSPPRNRPHTGTRLFRSFRQLDDLGPDRGLPVITLFSGGLDSTYLLHRLRMAGFRDVHALTVDVGDDETGEHKRQIADQLGATLHEIDGRKVFADEFVRQAVVANAVYLDTHPVSSTLSRPLIARLAVELARSLGAHAVLHTANRSQNTLRRLNTALAMLGFDGWYGSPYDLDPVDRGEKMQALKEVHLDRMSERIVSNDSNLWCREFESGILDDPEDHGVPEHMYRWSACGRPTPGEQIELTFRHGVPVAVDGRELPLDELIAVLNDRVGAYGLGRYSGLEHLEHGEKVLEVREMPAAWLILRSARHLQTAVLDAETIREKMHLEQVWVREALEGRWYGELRHAVQAFMDRCAAHLDGSVRWALTTGGAQTRAIVATHPRYVRDRETWERESIRREASAFGVA
jgi:argininosuccinate synthase